MDIEPLQIPVSVVIWYRIDHGTMNKIMYAVKTSLYVWFMIMELILVNK